MSEYSEMKYLYPNVYQCLQQAGPTGGRSPGTGPLQTMEWLGDEAGDDERRLFGCGCVLGTAFITEHKVWVCPLTEKVT